MLTILLCPVGRDWLSRLVAFGERGAGPAQPVHVAIDLHDGWTVAAEGGLYERGGIVARPASYYGPETTRWDLPLTPVQEVAVRADLTARVASWRYDWFQDALDAVNLLVGTRWINPMAARRHIANCSALAAEAVAAAGWWPFTWLGPSAAPAITPSDWDRARRAVR